MWLSRVCRENDDRVKRVLLTLALLLCLLPSVAQMQKVQIRPYIDQRRFHYGFFIGVHMQDMEFVNNGFVTEDGQSWFMDVNEYLPGFQVGVLGEMYLHKHIAAWLLPSLYFGDRKVVFKEAVTGERRYMQMRSCYVSVPVNFKFAAERVNNVRPYVVAGAAPIFNLTTPKQKELRVNTFDMQIEIGLGCDIYLPFFKLIPELKFCFGVVDIINKNRNDLTDRYMYRFTQSVDRATSRSIALTFYFE